MGGEQYACLMYGPNVEYSVKEWTEKLKVINKKEWVKHFMLFEKHDYEEPYDSDDEEGIDIVFDQEFNGDFLLETFLDTHHLSSVYKNNICWDEPMIGMIVKDYSTFIESKDMKDMQAFCEKYKLPDPTFYGGIYGEYE